MYQNWKKTIFFQDHRRILAQVAYVAGSMDEGLRVLSVRVDIGYEKIQQVCQETWWRHVWKDSAHSDGERIGIFADRYMAWSQLELHHLGCILRSRSRSGWNDEADIRRDEQAVTYKYIFQDIHFVADTEIVLADMCRMYNIQSGGVTRGLGNIQAIVKHIQYSRQLRSGIFKTENRN